MTRLGFKLTAHGPRFPDNNSLHVIARKYVSALHAVCEQVATAPLKPAPFSGKVAGVLTEAAASGLLARQVEAAAFSWRVVHSSCKERG
jgi:hypothetical protein